MAKKIGFIVVFVTFFALLAPSAEASTAAFRACVAGRINDRDNALIASNAGRTTVINNLIALRRSNLYSNWINITDDQARKVANQAIWANYVAQRQAILSSYENERQNIWGNYYAYKNQCKALNVPNTNPANLENSMY